MQLQEIPQKTMSCLRWHHFTMGSVRAVPYKDMTRTEVAPKCDLMKFASEARPSQYVVPFYNTEPTCMPLSGHFMDIEGRVLVHQTERHQPSLT